MNLDRFDLARSRRMGLDGPSEDRPAGVCDDASITGASVMAAIPIAGHGTSAESSLCRGRFVWCQPIRLPHAINDARSGAVTPGKGDRHGSGAFTTFVGTDRGA
jgi:hypothetical protein